MDDNIDRDSAIKEVTEEAKKLAVERHADPKTISVLTVSDMPLSYLPGNNLLINVTVVGDLLMETLLMSVKKLTFVDKKSLNAIALGGAVLGSGGGGDPYVGRLMTQQSIEKSGGVKVIDIESLPDDALILPIAMMGAPTVMVEKFPSGNEFAQLIPMIEKMLTKPVSAILCAEAGGLNSTIPFVAASKLGLPIIDGDAMGRAFPELQMVTFTLGGISATPMAMVDEKGNGCTFDTISNVWTEKLARAITIQMGGSAMCSLYPVTAKECKDYLIRGSLSLIHHIGNIIEKHSFNAYEILVKELNGKHLFQGRVRDVERRSEGGWNRGIVRA